MAGKNKDASLNKRAFTSGFFFILAQLFARGLTFAVTPVYSRLLTKAQYGVVRTYESWLLIAYTIMSLCLWRSVDVAKKDFEDDYNGYVSSVHTLSYIAIAFFFGLCMIFKTQERSRHDCKQSCHRTEFIFEYLFVSSLHIKHTCISKYIQEAGVKHQIIHLTKILYLCLKYHAQSKEERF